MNEKLKACLKKIPVIRTIYFKIDGMRKMVAELQAENTRLILMIEALSKKQYELEARMSQRRILVNDKISELNIKSKRYDYCADRLGELIHEIEKNEMENKNSIEKVWIKMKNLENSNKLELTIRKILNKPIYNNKHERQAIESFNEFYDSPDYKEAFLKLIDGLKEEDVALIVRILKRQQDIRNSKEEALDIYTKEEQRKISEVIECFKKEVFKVSDGLYCYHKYLLPVNHFEVSVLYYKHGIEYIKNIEYTRNRDIIDAGGYIGDSILVFSELTDRKVYSFEAVLENFQLMKKTIELNNIDNAVPENLALGAANGSVVMNVSGACSSSNDLVVDEVQYQQKVEMVSLDSYVKKNNLVVGLIKVDIEGAEQEFLKGAKETIERDKPILLLSIYHNANDFFHIKPMIENWDLGYKFKIYKPVDFSVSREVLLIAEIR